jgi:hypothetical protein
MEKALLNALDYLRKARWAGAETRDWARLIQLETKNNIDGIKQRGSKNTLEQNLQSVSLWENQIRSTIQTYMQDSTEMLLKIRLLNPPLTSENIKPFIDAIEKDRLATIAKINPLTACLDQLALLREQLRERRFPFIAYNPIS